MFAIACNAVGDFIAVTQLVSDIYTALSDSRGSHKDFQDLNEELRIFKTILSSDIPQLIAGSADVDLQRQVVGEVRRCADIINAMLDGIARFSLLGSDPGHATDTRGRLRRGGLKLRWQFSKRAEAREWRAKLEQCRGRLLLLLNMCVFGRAAHLRCAELFSARAARICLRGSSPSAPTC
jgi:hypothetical protein